MLLSTLLLFGGVTWAAMPTDPANTYYCPAGTLLCPKKMEMGWAGPQASTVQCVGKGKKVAPKVFNYARKNGQSNADQFWSALKVDASSVAPAAHPLDGEYALATKCCKGFQEEDGPTDADNFLYNQCQTWVEPPKGKTCATGCKSWFDGCNTCSCTDDGKVGACTRMFCLTNKEPMCKDDQSGGDGEGKTCATGCKAWFDGCNKCMCKDGKIGGCTKMFCATKKPAKCMDDMNGGGGEEEGKTCATGCKAWFDGCNRCRCTEDGKIGACTEMFCATKKPAKCMDDMNGGGGGGKTCATGCKAWFDGCNSCRCTDDGKVGACTKKACAMKKPAKCMDDDNNGGGGGGAQLDCSKIPECLNYLRQCAGRLGGMGANPEALMACVVKAAPSMPDGKCKQCTSMKWKAVCGDKTVDECDFSKEAKMAAACFKKEAHECPKEMCRWEEGACQRGPKISKKGEACGSCFNQSGWCGKCGEGLKCDCVGDCANEMIADAPSTCVPDEPNACETAADCKAKSICGQGFCVDKQCVFQEIACDMPRPGSCPDGSDPKPIKGKCCAFECPKNRCPAKMLAEGSVGICVEECKSNAACKGDEEVTDRNKRLQPICCKNACGGGVCVKPVSKEGDLCGSGAFWDNPKCDEGLVCKGAPQRGDVVVMDRGSTCQKPCPKVACKMNCPNGMKKDENGCMMCECEEEKCPLATCAIFCENGKKLDENGCETCQCNKCPQMMCRMFCDEYEKDDNGCQMCKCKQPEKCKDKPMCKMFCEHGYLKDDDGCNVCKCAKEDDECPKFMCAMHCENGFQTGKDGCKMCKCAEPDVCPLLGCNAKLGCKEVDSDKDGCGDACRCPRDKFNCKSRESWTAEKKAWCCKVKNQCDQCDTPDDCAKTMQFEEGSCSSAVCFDGRCQVVEIACDQPVCKDGSFPAAIEGKCCAFEPCPEDVAKLVKKCKNTKQCEKAYTKKWDKPTDPCTSVSCDSSSKKCLVDKIACAALVPMCDNGKMPKKDPATCCGYFPCSEECSATKKTQCAKKKGCKLKGKKCVIDSGDDAPSGGDDGEKDECKGLTKKNCNKNKKCKAKMKKKKFLSCDKADSSASTPSSTPSSGGETKKCKDHKTVKACVEAGCKAKKKGKKLKQCK